MSETLGAIDLPISLTQDILDQINQSCALALTNQLNKNESDPTLKALADKWKTMDAFSKRELGQPDTLTPAQIAQQQTQQNTTQVNAGQEATVTGPATILGGQVSVQPPTTP